MGNLFRYSSLNIVTLKEIILSEIDVYYKNFKMRNVRLSKNGPLKRILQVGTLC